MAILLFGMVPVRAGAATSQLACTPTNLRFGAVVVGRTETFLVTVTNNGLTSVTISGITVDNSEFTTSYLSLPLVLPAGQSVDLSVSFTPTAMKWTGGTIKFFSNASNATLHLDAGGTGVSSESVTASPSMVSFGQVAIGTISTVPVVLTNARSWKVTVSALQTTGGFSMSGPMFPLTLGAGQSVTLNIAFAPQSAGTTGGSLFVSGPQLAIPLTGTGTAPGQLAANPSSSNFANVPVGSSQMQSATLTNSGVSSLTVSQATLTGPSFALSGLTLPLTLGAGQSAPFSIVFAPKSAGSVSGNVAFTSNASNPAMNLPLSGTGVTQGTLTANPTSLAFGNVQVGNNTSLSETLTNTGGTSLTVSAAAASGSGLSLSGLSLPLTLTAGQSTSFTVLFSPSMSGAASESVSITSNGSNPNLSIPLSGTGVTQGTLGANPTSLAFGSVQVGNSSSLSETLTNSGGSSLTISAATASGTGFSLSGLTLPLTLNAGQSTSFTVLFAPTAGGAVSGSVSITSNGANPNLSIPLSGTGGTPGTLAANSTSLAFGNVQVGNSTNLSETLTNTGGSTITISQANLTGAAFAISGLILPLNLTANQSVTFTATFKPTSAGAASGSLSVVSNASNSQLNIALSGSGATAGQLAVSPTSLSFGNVVVGSSAALNGSLTASGAPVTVSPASINSGEFALSGISLPATLAAGQSATFTVTFTPGASGAASASLSFSSNASNSPAVQTMTGTGTAATQHIVDL
ncbi:MAG TPA: choice-of-anchor D domain-containing protein, partial [Terriglobales bacterium]|nr:choice-of-anchor D domain-containing protein [Terriglobales bacterium]